MALVYGIANKKGGVGKSSIANLFAITSANEPINKKVLVIDATNNKLLSYLSSYNNQGYYTCLSSELDEVPQVLATEALNYDVILIDFSTDSSESGFKSAAMCCSFFIIPTGVGIMDQISTKDFLGDIEEVTKLRKAAGYDTDYKVLASNVSNSEYGDELYKVLDKQKVNHFEFSLVNNLNIGELIDAGKPVMDYVTEGVGWTEAQDIFHKVFIEFHSLTE